MSASLIAKAATSGLIVLTILWLANLNPKLAGWLTAMPLITGLSVIWLLLDRQPRPVLATYLTGVLIGVGHTALVLSVVLLRLKSGAPFGQAVGAGFVVWGAAAALIYQARMFA